MWTDEIVAEIHKIWKDHAKSLNNDLAAIFTDLRKKEAASGREVVNLSRRSGAKSRWSGRIKEDSHSKP